MLWLVIGSYLAAAVLIYWQQRRLIYFPPELPPQVVEQQARTDRLEPWRNNKGQNIGWKRLSPTRPAVGQVLILHGNAGSAVYCGHYADSIQQVAPLDVFMLEYPGYSGRPGSPNEHSLYEAAEDGLALLVAPGPVYLLGESLGTGVAAYLAGGHPETVSGLILLAPYNSLVAVGQSKMRIFPINLLMKDRFPAEAHLRNYQGPIAFLVVNDDQVVPAKFGRALHEAYSGPKRLWELPRGNHEAILTQPPEWWREALGFLRQNPTGSR